MDSCLKLLCKSLPYYALSAAIAGADLAIKSMADRDRVHFKGTIRNSGFAGSRMEAKPERVAFISALSTGMLFCLLPFIKGKIRRLGYALMLGGGMSNTIERLRKRYVVDYIPLGKYVYNIGDFSIFAGAGITTAALIKRES